MIWRKPDTGPWSELIWAPELHLRQGAWYVYFAAAPSREIVGGLFQHRMYALRCGSADPMTGDWEFLGQVDSGVELQASGRRFDDAGNAYRLGGYGLLNLYTTWHLTRDWSLLARVDNAADKHYELARNYGTAGRSWFAGIRYGIR